MFAHIGDWIRNLGAVTLLVASIFTTGCGPQKKQSLIVKGMDVSDYKFDYEMVQPSTIETKGKTVLIKSGTQRIEIVEGKLSVDSHSYGAVQPNDSISVLNGEVKVNGITRQPDKP